jgi:hypothetical protein
MTAPPTDWTALVPAMSAPLDALTRQSLRTQLAGAPTTVVFYCRRWSELIPSLRRETVKHGSLTA